MAAARAASKQWREDVQTDYKTNLENRVRSLAEMKQNQGEVETDEERRELRKAVDSAAQN